jgi:uncharacterized protein (DUF488 family)
MLAPASRQELSLPSEIWTVGHSNLPFELLLASLDKHAIDLVVDVRFRPRSRFAQYDLKSLGKKLGTRYLWDGNRLGNPAGFGLEPIAPDLYAAGIADLEQRARDGQRVAIMCSEGDYRECHRHTMIAPDLERDGFRVIHIARPRYTAPRRIRPDAELPCV